MAFVHGKNAKVYVNGADLSPYLRRVTTDLQANAVDTSTIGTNSRRYIAGQLNSNITADGLWDQQDLTGGGIYPNPETILGPALGTDFSIWTILPAGDAAGGYGYTIKSDETQYEITAPYDNAVAFTVAAQGCEGYSASRILQVLGAETATGNGTGVDNTTASTNGGTGVLQVTAGSPGAATLVVKVQHSPDNTTYTDLITFASVLGSDAPTSQRLTVAGTVNRYVRAQWTITGSTPSFTFSLLFGRG